MAEKAARKSRVRVSEQDAQFLEKLGAQLGLSAEEMLRRILLPLRLMAAQDEALGIGLTDDELANRAVRSMLVALDIKVAPRDLRMLGNAYLRAADEIDERNAAEHRKEIAASMLELRESIRRRVGTIPDVAALVDMGRGEQ